MKLKLSLSSFVLLALATVSVFAFFLLEGRAPKTQASVYNATAISVATTSTSVAVTGSGSVQVLASTTSLTGTSYTRVYATLCNATANPVYISLNGDKPTATGVGTAVIAAAAGYNACYEITDRNQYSGSIRASSTVASTNISAVEYVQ